MVNYLFEDVFYHFMFFFNYNENKDTKFLYDISFGLKPRIFNKNADFCTIYDEEDEVMEMYLIQSGVVGVGFYLYLKVRDSDKRL